MEPAPIPYLALDKSRIYKMDLSSDPVFTVLQTLNQANDWLKGIYASKAIWAKTVLHIIQYIIHCSFQWHYIK